MPSVAVIPGDGIGPEVTEQGVRVLEAASDKFSFPLETRRLAIGAERYLATGQLLTEADVDELRLHDAFLLGALGDPRVAPGLLERDVIVAARRALDLAVNVRPLRVLPGIVSPLSAVNSSNCDFVVVRENTEGLYAGGSSTARLGTTDAVAVQASITTTAATTAVIEYAFELAITRRSHLTLCHKTNILVDAGRIWMDVLEQISGRYPQVQDRKSVV